MIFRVLEGLQPEENQKIENDRMAKVREKHKPSHKNKLRSPVAMGGKGKMTDNNPLKNFIQGDDVDDECLPFSSAKKVLRAF